MKIKYKNNGNFEVEFNEYFKTVDDLKTYIKNKNKYINVVNLEDKINKIYLELCELDLSLKSSVLDWFIIGRFCFKYKRPNNLNFWLERGNTIDDFNNFIGKIINSLNENVKNNFQYNNFKFELIGIPKCKLCGSELKIEPSIGRYQIIKCLNEDCDTNRFKHIKSISHLSFLPLEVYKNKNNRINIESKLTKEYWLLKGVSYEDSFNEIDKIKKTIENVNKNSFNYYKLTTDKSDNEINKLIKKSKHLCVEYWLSKGFSEEDARNKIISIQQKNAEKLNELRKNNPNNYSATTYNQLGYWLKKGYSESESKKIISEKQITFSLEKCIQKYGEEEGKRRFTERQNKWSDSLNNNGNLKIGYSNISQELFYKLLETYDIVDRNKIYFATHNKEFRLSKNEGGLWLYDFTDTINKKIIEYNGDDYHGNPNKYKANDYPNHFNKNITAQEMWNKDKLKLDVAKKHGFDIMVIWDSEYRWGNKQEIINKCIAFLNKD